MECLRVTLTLAVIPALTNRLALKLSGASTEVNSEFISELSSNAYREWVVRVCVVAAESGLV